MRKVIQAAHGQTAEVSPTVTQEDATRHAVAHVFERHSVAPQHCILEAALVKGRGQLNLGQLKEALASRPQLVRAGTEFSTRDILTMELFLTRKATVELQGLRDELARLGFAPRKHDKTSASARRFRMIRPTRITRATRLAPVQRLVQVVEDVARWIGDKLEIEGLAQPLRYAQLDSNRHAIAAIAVTHLSNVETRPQ